MAKPKKNTPPEEIPEPAKIPPEFVPETDPENPVLPTEPDFVPEEDPLETPPPSEIPAPGEDP